MKMRDTIPVEVYRRAHLEYPAEVGRHHLYGAAFFGHSNPPGVKRTTASVWRGLVRRHLAAYVLEVSGVSR